MTRQRLGLKRKRPVSVAIVGGGLGGLCMGVRLKEAGYTNFKIFEQSGGPGGTWWDNTYPDCGVDVPSHMYSYSFLTRYEWLSTHGSQKELLQYIWTVIDKYGLRDYLHFNTTVTSAEWDETEAHYDLTFGDGATESFDVFVSAVGRLSVPNDPTWPGLDSFEGIKFHSSRWNHDVDFAGKRVAVVGTGSSSAQIVPAVARTAEHLDVFQRQPGWVVPKGARVYDDSERERLRTKPWIISYRRMRTIYLTEKVRRSYESGTDEQEQRRQMALNFIERSIADPELKKLMTPDYALSCKRPVISDDFYPALQRENVDLVPLAVQRITEHGVVDVKGVEHQADVLIMATGFQAANYLSTLDVRGVGGLKLHDYWGTEPHAFMCICIPNFPNFFMISGPNGTVGSAIFMQEQQANWILHAVKLIAKSRISSIDVRPDLEKKFNDWLDKNLVSKVYAEGCTNYYKTPGGRIVHQWPASITTYLLMTRLLRPSVIRSWGRRSKKSKATAIA